MKKIIVLLLIFLVICLPKNIVFAEDKPNIDSALEEVISGIDEKDFTEITELLNIKFNENLSIKDWVILFISGEFSLTLKDVSELLSSLYNDVITSVSTIVVYIIFIGVFYSIINIINSKNNGKSAKYIIYYICYAVVITLSSGLVFKVFDTAKNSITDMSKVVDGCFPIVLSLNEFLGGFGVNIIKPLTGVVSFFTSVLTINLFLPLLSTSIVCVVVGNLSETIKLDSLKKTILSFIKWVLGIITVVFTVVIAGQSVVNSQYSGISFKVLKYATGSMIPIVGGFISGGLDVLLSSAILVKNSVGLILVIYVFLNVLSAGVTVLIVSFILKFAVSVAEPILDGRFCKLLNGIGEVLSYLTAVIFICGFSYILVCFSLISTTALII